MTRKQILKYGVARVFLLGVLISAYPFVLSMNPSESAYNALPHINLDTIEAGSHVYADSGHSVDFGHQWLILKNRYNSVNVYTIPIYKGKFMLSDIEWFKLGGTCEDFRPEIEDGYLKENGIVKCHDVAENQWYDDEWRWSYGGKNLGQYTEDLRSPHFTIEDNY